MLIFIYNISTLVTNANEVKDLGLFFKTGKLSIYSIS